MALARRCIHAAEWLSESVQVALARRCIHSQSSIQLTDIRKSIQTQSADKIIVMYNDHTDISDIESELKTFDSTFEIQYLYDNQLETNDAKILVYKGRTP